MKKKASLKTRLITIFALTSTIPLLTMGIWMAFDTVRNVQETTGTLTRTNLEQMDESLHIQIEAYEDVVNQIYYNDDVVAWVEQLNADSGDPVVVRQMRRYMGSLLYTKDYISSITIIADSGQKVTYNNMSAQSYEDAWMKTFSMSQEELYRDVSADNKMHIYETEYGTSFAGSDIYLFHIAHRIINYKDLEQRVGIVVISVDERLLNELLQPDTETADISNLLLDRNGRIISAQDQQMLGQAFDTIPLEQAAAYYSFHDETLNWDLVNVVWSDPYRNALTRKLVLIFAVSMLLLGISVSMILRQVSDLADAVGSVAENMRRVGDGDLSIRIRQDERRPLELETIIEQFNEMTDRLNRSLDKERQAMERQAEAEIKMLEAQINPHFLYNTLDTINWMAIDQEAYDVSNAISSLGYIFRYAIHDSDALVTVEEEEIWLKKYLYLQQFRLKGQLQYRINISPEARSCRIHKLLLQPFVENAVVHGFNRKQEQYVLEVSIVLEEEKLHIRIMDNGIGMSEEIAERIRRGQSVNDDEKAHIGLDNAILRLHRYSGGKDEIHVQSTRGEGTVFDIIFPILNVR
ncbi:MAG: sensor histidine kinase [Lachnospiraceae bacterium]|nr:sensor histidine kinase [Lachnospiraceae bacterium]